MVLNEDIISILIKTSMAQPKIPELVLKLQQLAKPTFVNSRWRKPAISARRLADMRKSLVAEGVYWPPKPMADRGGDKPFKLIKHERDREKRYRAINRHCMYVLTPLFIEFLCTCTYIHKSLLML